MNKFLSMTVKSLHHNHMMGKAAYITRDKYMSSYLGRTYNFLSKQRDNDLIGNNTLFPRGSSFETVEEMINDLECNYAIKRNAIVGRDIMFSINNNFIIKKEDGNVDKKATYEFIKDDLEKFLHDNFVNGKNGQFGVTYALHFNSSKDQPNYHIHIIQMGHSFQEHEGWQKKSYRDDKGNKVYINDLDDKYRSKQALKRIRDTWCDIENKKLKELGISNEKSISKSYEELGISHTFLYHLPKHHHEELEQLKQKYNYCSGIKERNELIIKDRTENGKIKLTKKQLHNLYAEIKNDENEKQQAIKLINDAMKTAKNNSHKLISNAEFKAEILLENKARQIAQESKNGAKKGIERGR